MFLIDFCVCCFLARKKAQLKRKRGISFIHEQMLFHGTSSEFVEAICIHNFDWRINGVHATAYGKGKLKEDLPCTARGWHLLEGGSREAFSFGAGLPGPWRALPLLSTLPICSSYGTGFQ